MKHIGPPAWMKFILRFLLPVRDRETVVGDLYEEFCDRRASRQGPMRASLWYLLQTISFAPHKFRFAFFQPRILALLCTFTTVCSCWLGVISLRLQHPGYVEQIGIASGILLQALLTLGALHFRRSSFLRYLSMFGCLVLFWLAGKVLIATIRGAEPEGYVLLIAVALLFQALLTLRTLPGADEPGMLV